MIREVENINRIYGYQNSMFVEFDNEYDEYFTQNLKKYVISSDELLYMMLNAKTQFNIEPVKANRKYPRLITIK